MVITLVTAVSLELASILRAICSTLKVNFELRSLDNKREHGQFSFDSVATITAEGLEALLLCRNLVQGKFPPTH